MTTPPVTARVGESFEQEYPTAQRSASECYINLVRTGDRLVAELGRGVERDVLGVLDESERATLLGYLERIQQQVRAVSAEPPVLADAPRVKPRP